MGYPRQALLSLAALLVVCALLTVAAAGDATASATPAPTPSTSSFSVTEFVKEWQMPPSAKFLKKFSAMAGATVFAGVAALIVIDSVLAWFRSRVAYVP